MNLKWWNRIDFTFEMIGFVNILYGIVWDYFEFFKIKIKENSSVGNDTPHYSDQLNL